MKIFKLILPSILMLTSTYLFAQSESNLNIVDHSSKISTEGKLTIDYNVPALCNITNNSKTVMNVGDYLNTAIDRNFTYQFNCTSGANMKFHVGNGINPQSTTEARRMNLNGVAGDAEHYMLYTIGVGNTLVGGPEPYSYFVASNSSNDTRLSFRIKVPVEQPNLIVGKYSDQLDITIEYF